MEAYGSLYREAVRQQLPLFFRRDLTFWDLKILTEKDPPKQFGWTLGPMGTHVVDPRMDRQSLQGYLDFFKTEGRCLLFYIWDGCELSQCSYPEFKTLMVAMFDNFRSHCACCGSRFDEARFTCDHSMGTVRSMIDRMKQERGSVKRYAVSEDPVTDEIFYSISF